ncbi:MAG: helix-turn-helix transcriptional regulator [Oscillospiraceae bacterium]|nr:helix-turn-helix transcriptional regulator [Oscillospiraceae bacterium]
MDLAKIGNFIAQRRKAAGLTQMQLAERLNITDRAVSKWERGLSLPDASIMLALCGILGISVNELFVGEMLEMKQNDQKTEALLLELAALEEQKNKKLLVSALVFAAVLTVFYVGVALLAEYALPAGPLQNAVMCAATALFVLAAFFVLKTEVTAGYYACPHCGHRHVPSVWQVSISVQMGWVKWLKCPACGRRGWHKKVLQR